MTMKKIFIISYSTIIGGIIVLGILSMFMNQAEKMLNQKQEIRYRSYMLADQLRQSSDELTRMARTYVLTGDTKYEKIYWDILAIRNGEKRRPEEYDRIYWDLVLEYGDKPRPDGEAVSLQHLMQEAGFIAASANITEPDPGAEGFPIVRERQDNVSLNTIMSNSFGFGGTNSTLIFQRLAD